MKHKEDADWLLYDGDGTNLTVIGATSRWCKLAATQDHEMGSDGLMELGMGCLRRLGRNDVSYI